MSTTFSDRANFPVSPPISIAVTFHERISWRAIEELWRLPQLWAARRAQRKTLSEVAEEKHLLEDIGLTRVQALREAAKPFWQQ